MYGIMGDPHQQIYGFREAREPPTGAQLLG